MSSSQMPGIGAATGTMMDSAAKHTLACRVDEDKMHAYADTQNILQNKHKYCVNRHELTLNTSNSWLPGSITPASVYPHIISNLGDIDPFVKKLLRVIYTVLDVPQGLQQCRDVMRFLSTNEQTAVLKNQLNALPFFHAQGYSLGVAYANHRQGDIVCAVQVGGMVTVRNGHFACQTGDMMQWYFDFEVDMFESNDTRIAREGERKYGDVYDDLIVGLDDAATAVDFAAMKAAITAFNPPANAAAANSTTKRKRHVDMQLGMVQGKINIPYPKPYILSAGHGDHYGDRMRVFAKCINGGRAHDMIDIMLMTQSL